MKKGAVGSAFTPESLSTAPTLAAIGDHVYDIGAFSKAHPGGEILLMFGGTDATVAYHTIHPRHYRERDQVHNSLVPFRVGTYKANAEACGRNYFFDSEFALDLQRSVERTLQAKRSELRLAKLGYMIRTLLYAVLYFHAWYLWMTNPSWVIALYSGFMSAMVDLNISHDGSHGAFAGTPWGNLLSEVLCHFFDLTGSPTPMWYQQHVQMHHPFTNDYDCDKDISSAEPFFLFHPPQQQSSSKWYYAYQHLLWPVWLHFYGVSVAFNPWDTPRLTKYPDRPGEISPLQNPYIRERRWRWYGLHLVSHLGYTIIPLFNASNKLLFFAQLYLLYAVVSLVLATLFMLSHNFEGSLRYDSKADATSVVDHTHATTNANAHSNMVDWYKVQVESSCTYGGWPAGWVTGNLNFQIEHHLYPRMPSCYYSHIQDTVREVCKRHKVTYTYFPSRWQNLMSTAMFLKHVGRGKIA
jgi:fatty acid desaturase